MAFKAPSKAWQGGATLQEIKMIHITSGGQLVSCHIFYVHTPQSSEFLSEVWANSKGSLPQDQHPANQIQLNSSSGRAGGGFLFCDTQRNFWKSAKIPPSAQHFGHEGLVKTKLSNYIYCKKSMDKAFFTFLFNIAPLEIKILLPELN
jgi:hypothetical protein